MNAWTHFIACLWLRWEERAALVDDHLARQRGDFAAARRHRADAQRAREDLADLRHDRWLDQAPQ